VLDNPKNENGDYICNMQTPMPTGRDTSNEWWVHEDVTEIELDTVNMHFKCNACGQYIIIEMPD
jgi:hypothetical protein